MPDTKAVPIQQSPSKVMTFWLSWSTTIQADACIYAAALLACALFYLRWNFWEDQAAQAYMTWGLFHGMKPYVDLVDPNWPGILLPHTAAYLVAGINPWGLRALDLIFLYALLLATSSLLASWGTPLSLRILAGSAYLTNYFATGWMWTAQRESFCWPLFVISVIPFLKILGAVGDALAPRRLLSKTAWFGFGVTAGLCLWIKPSPWPAIVAVYLMTALLCNQQDRPSLLRAILWHMVGIAAVSIVFILTLAGLGELPGFIKWGILYVLGPYAQVKFSWPARLIWSWHFLTDPNMRNVALVLAVLATAAAIFCPRHLRRWRNPARPIIASIVLLIASALAVLLQGKPSSLYHFIPLDWSLAFYTATIASVILWNKTALQLAMAAAFLLVALTVYQGPAIAGPTHGTLAADWLKPRLAPGDELVEWGYAPSLLLAAQRPTPLMTFTGSALLVTSPSDSWASREVLDRLNIALQNPSVKFLLVEHVPNYKMRDDMLTWPADYLKTDVALNQTLRNQYLLLPNNPVRGFEVYVHEPAAAAPRPN